MATTRPLHTNPLDPQHAQEPVSDPFADPMAPSHITPPAYIEHYAPQTSVQAQPQTQTQPQLHVDESSHDINDNASILPPYPYIRHAHNPWARYPSESAYLDALRAWAKEKEYMEPLDAMGRPTRLIGFYGNKTSEDYISQAGPGLNFEGIKWVRRRKERKNGGGKREAEGAGVGVVQDRRRMDGDGNGDKEGDVKKIGGGSRAAGDGVRRETGRLEHEEEDDQEEEEGDFGHPSNLERSITAPGQQYAQMNTADTVVPGPGRRRSSISNWVRKMRTNNAG